MFFLKKNQFQCLAVNFERLQSGLRLCSTGRLSHVTEKKGKLGMMNQEAILSPKQEGRAIRSLPVTFPLGTPSVIKGSGVGRFIKTVYAAWGTQRSLSGLEMAAVFIAFYIKSDPINTRAALVWTHQPFRTTYAGSRGTRPRLFSLGWSLKLKVWVFNAKTNQPDFVLSLITCVFVLNAFIKYMTFGLYCFCLNNSLTKINTVWHMLFEWKKTSLMPPPNITQSFL